MKNRTTQEVIAEQQSINRKLYAMNHKEHGEHHTVIMGALACLGDADGETIEAVIRLLGMTEQLTRQLFMTASNETIIQLMHERLEQ